MLKFSLSIPTPRDALRVTKSVSAAAQAKVTKTNQEKFANSITRALHRNADTTVWVLDFQTNGVTRFVNGSPVPAMVNHGAKAIAEAQGSIQVGHIVVTRDNDGNISTQETAAPTPDPSTAPQTKTVRRIWAKVEVPVNLDDVVAEPVAV